MRIGAPGQWATPEGMGSTDMIDVWKDTRHLLILSGLLLVVGFSAWQVRAWFIPASFGELGPYRAAALTELAAQPSRLAADSVCHACHDDVRQVRSETRHAAVLCIHCHGLATQHVAHAQRAQADPSLSVPPATPWDGHVNSQVDLYITQDRRVCLVCHASVVGMPATFKKIDPAQHLEEMGASAPDAPETCFECHGGHDTAPK